MKTVRDEVTKGRRKDERKTEEEEEKEEIKKRKKGIKKMYKRKNGKGENRGFFFAKRRIFFLETTKLTIKMVTML